MPAPLQQVTYERAAPTARVLPADNFAHLPVSATIELIPEEVKADPTAYERIGEERSFEIDVVAPQLVKREIIRPKYRHKTDRSRPPVVAPAPARAVAGGYASAGLLAWVTLSKYVEHQPLYAGPGIKRPMPGDGLCRVGAGGTSTAVAQDPA
jgi:transposase